MPCPQCFESEVELALPIGLLAAMSFTWPCSGSSAEVLKLASRFELPLETSSQVMGSSPQVFP